MTETPAPVKSRNISNSELSAWLQCERKYYYNFDLGIEPKQHGAALSRGIAGHIVLEHYYKHLLDNPGDFSGAQQTAGKKLADLFANGEFDMEILIDLQRLFNRYWPYSQERDAEWKILAVEREYHVELTPQYTYSMKLDVLIRDKGELVLVDHKFVYDFYKQSAVDLMPQIPKYLATLRANGLNIDRGMLNMLRWRMKKGPMTDDELFDRMTIKPHPDVLVNIMREQMLGSQQILAHRELTLDQRRDSVLRSMNKMNCQNCSYNPLCYAELSGHDIEVDIKLNYQPVTYGYNDEGTES